MIKKTLITLFILILINAFIRTFSENLKPVAHEFWQENQINAQRYIYSRKHYETIIVGTSLGSKIQEDKLNNAYNLSMIGKTPFEGLELIKKKGVYPKYLLVELNMLNYAPENDLSKYAFNPIVYYLRKYLHIMKDGEGLIDFSVDRIEKDLIPDSCYNLVLYDKGIFHYSVRPLTMPRDSAKLINSNLSRFNPYSQEILNRMTKNLNPYMEVFKTNGTQVIFYQTPFDKYLCNTPDIMSIRETLKHHYPYPDYLYIPLVDCSDDYKTFDGSHLNEEGGLNYSLFLKQQLDSFSDNEKRYN